MDEIDNLIAMADATTWFILSIIVLITFFVIAYRIKKIMNNTKQSKDILYLEALTRGNIIQEECVNCSGKQGLWKLKEGTKCLDCGNYSKSEY